MSVDTPGFVSCGGDGRCAKVWACVYEGAKLTSVGHAQESPSSRPYAREFKTAHFRRAAREPPVFPETWLELMVPMRHLGPVEIN